MCVIEGDRERNEKKASKAPPPPSSLFFLPIPDMIIKVLKRHRGSPISHTYLSIDRPKSYETRAGP